MALDRNIGTEYWFTNKASLLCSLLFQRFSKNAVMQAKVKPAIKTTNTPPTLLRLKALAPLSCTSWNQKIKF